MVVFTSQRQNSLNQRVSNGIIGFVMAMLKQKSQDGSLTERYQVRADDSWHQAGETWASGSMSSLCIVGI